MMESEEFRMSSNDGGVVAEVLGKHGRSAQPESQQLVAVLHAVCDVVRSENLQVTPTSLFAATMSALEKPETQSAPQVCLAMCTLLGYVLPRMLNATLRLKFVSCSTVLCAVLEKHKHQANQAKAALQCLSSVLSAMDPSHWPSAVAPFSALLAFILDNRPKVRKRAHQGVLEVLASVQAAPPALGPASEAIAKICQTVLPGPEAAAKAAAAASNKQRSAAEEDITKAVADALHLLGLLKMCIGLLATQPTRSIVDLLFKLYPLRQPLLSRHATEVLTALCGSSNGTVGAASAARLPAGTLAEVMGVVLDAGEQLWDRKDADAVLSLTRLLETGFIRLAQLDPGMCAQRLPRAFHALVPQLCALQDGVRFGTSQALRNLIVDCISAPMVAAASTAHNGAPMWSILAALTSALGASYQEAWPLALPVVGTMLEHLGGLPGGKHLAGGLIQALGSILSGTQDAMEEDEDTAMGAAGAGSAPVSVAAESALGSALRSLGPEVVLEALPLNLHLIGSAGKQQQGSAAESSEMRTWMLPLLRRHVRGCGIGFWGRHLLPLAKSLAAQCQAAEAAGKGSGALAQACHVLEIQIWACLPAFVSWAPDLPSSYSAYVKDMAAAFQNLDYARPAVSQAVERMCLQVRRALRQAGKFDMVGLGEPIGEATRHHGSNEDEDGTLLLLEEGGVEGQVGKEGDDDDGATTVGGGNRERSAGSVRASTSAHKGRRNGKRGRHVEEAEGEEEGHWMVPEGYTAETAVAAAGAIKQFTKNWLVLLFKVFLAQPPEQRGITAATISACCSLAEPAVLAPLFRAVITKLIKVVQDAVADVPPPDMITEGGADPVSRRCSFLELALCTASGLDDAGLSTLFKAAKPGLSESDPAVQKKCYKVLAYLCEQRPAFVRSHLEDVLPAVVEGAESAVSASRRYRLRCLQPLVLLLSSPQCPKLPASLKAKPGEEEEEEEDDLNGNQAKEQERREDIVVSLVSEIVLCVKESNTKSRGTAYALLVKLAHAMDEAEPEEQEEEEDDAMETSAHSQKLQKGGLNRLFSIVMAGLVGATPHMMSATVMALARLLYEFAGRLDNAVPRLMPAVLMLLRTKSREIVKSVLGFVKVCAMRLPVDLLTPQLGPILEGLLLWAEDSKNKFKLKVRIVVERLARRCGFQALAAVMPASDSKLLAHIRKQVSRKQRKRSNANSEDGEEEEEEEGGDAKSRLTGLTQGGKSMARTARASEWGHSKIFSEDGGAASTKSGRRSMSGGMKGARLEEGGDDPMDLLDASTTRHLVKASAGQAGQGRRSNNRTGDENVTFGRDGESGRMVIEEEEMPWVAKAKRAAAKRRREADGGGDHDDGFDSQDSDFEDLRGVADLGHAMRREGAKTVRFAKSVAGASSKGGKSTLGGKSTVGGRSVSGRSDASRGSRGDDRNKKGPAKHSGDRFKPRKNTTGGDTAGKSSVEPYAYWQFDRKMLNRRRAKQAGASKSLTTVVRAVQAGAVRGAKAKRVKAGGLASNKRRRTAGSDAVPGGAGSGGQGVAVGGGA